MIHRTPSKIRCGVRYQHAEKRDEKFALGYRRKGSDGGEEVQIMSGIDARSTQKRVSVGRGRRKGSMKNKKTSFMT